MALRRILCVVLGGVCFWMPTAVIEIVTRRELRPAVGTFVPPVALLTGYFLLRRRVRLKNAALWMLAGVFTLGPLFMMAGATALGAGFGQFAGWQDLGYFALECVVPPLTLVLAGYDGTFFGLLLATALMPLIQWWINRRDAARPHSPATAASLGG